MPKRVGLIGFPIGHSISPAFQQAAFDHLGLPVRYELWETPPDDLPARLREIRDSECLGVNVTIPYKERVLEFLDEVEELARRIGAVNTIVNREGRLCGYNTDAKGAILALRETGFDPHGRTALILGAGGAARAVGFALLDAGLRKLFIANRTLARARSLAEHLSLLSPSIFPIPWEKGEIKRAVEECDLLVNCTPVGMRFSPEEGRSPLPPSLIPERILVFDLVYNPPETPLLLSARERGARILGGLPMVVLQGAEAFRLWTGLEPPVDVMMRSAKKALGLPEI